MMNANDADDVDSFSGMSFGQGMFYKQAFECIVAELYPGIDPGQIIPRDAAKYIKALKECEAKIQNHDCSQTMNMEGK